jgi:uncharacterized membrane protein
MEYLINNDVGYTVAASILTSIGMGTNDIPQMIGGMLISPLANPLIRIVDTRDILTNVVHLIVLICTTTLIGMLYFYLFLSGDSEFKPTERMINIAHHGESGYWNDVVYGLVTGICLFAIRNKLNDNNTNILAGLAIGVTILPAFVNAGIMFSAGLHGFTDLDGQSLNKYGKSSSYVGMIYLVTILIGLMGGTLVSGAEVNER